MPSSFQALHKKQKEYVLLKNFISLHNQIAQHYIFQLTAGNGCSIWV